MSTELFFADEDTKFFQFLHEKDKTRFCLLVDAKTNGFCLPLLLAKFPFLRGSPVIIIPDGEGAKRLDVLSMIWGEMLRFRLEKNSILINLGGGMVSDIGGLAASTYKRGIQFINIPTTLLALVDACLGGKTGIDYDGYKNIIGTFQMPLAVYISSEWLKSLSQRIKKSGIAEMIKHILISSTEALLSMEKADETYFYTLDAIRNSIKIKNNFVEKDPMDLSIRQSLNFGHSIGHAVESFYLQTSKPLLHGEAVIIGMYYELKLSEEILQLNSNVLVCFSAWQQRVFPELDLSINVKDILPFLLQDKKNEDSIRMSLLSQVGQPQIKQKVSMEMLKKVIQ